MNLSQSDLASLAASIQAIDARNRIAAALKLWAGCRKALAENVATPSPRPPVMELCRLCVALSGGVDPHLAIADALAVWDQAGQSLQASSKAEEWSREKSARLGDAMRKFGFDSERVTFTAWLKAMMPKADSNTDRIKRYREFLRMRGLPPHLISADTTGTGNEGATIAIIKNHGFAIEEAAAEAVKFQQWDREFRKYLARSKATKAAKTRHSQKKSGKLQKPIELLEVAKIPAKQQKSIAKGPKSPAKQKSIKKHQKASNSINNQRANKRE